MTACARHECGDDDYDVEHGDSGDRFQEELHAPHDDAEEAEAAEAEEDDEAEDEVEDDDFDVDDGWTRTKKKKAKRKKGGARGSVMRLDSAEASAESPLQLIANVRVYHTKSILSHP